MAHQALGSGTVTRKRALFGLLDRDGWAWAFVKAFIWFWLAIFLLMYLPDRAYYFTVNSTIELGLRNDALTPINLCPPANETLPCPAPIGAILPWHESPKELALPAARRDGVVVQAGTRLLYIGGSDGTAASADVYVADLYPTGNFSAWRPGPPLPDARTHVGAAFLAGSIYVVGGDDKSGKPTDTTFVLTPDPKTGSLGDWLPAVDPSTAPKLALKLPEARDGATLLPTGDGLVLVGGRGPNGPAKSVWKSSVDTAGAPQAWKAQADLPQPRADAVAALAGDFLFVYGGSDDKGPTADVLRGHVSKDKSSLGQITGWDTGRGASNLPAARTSAAGFNSNGTLYLLGGTDGTGPKSEVYWTVPTATGDITSWSHLPSSDLPAGGRAGSSAVASGSAAFVIGGATASGVSVTSLRTNLAPKPPFFQVGFLGATVPALKIEGDIGPQLGLVNAAGVGTVNFVLFIIAGWAFAHQAQVAAFRDRIRRRRRGGA